MRVLIADDDLTSRAVLAAVLRKCGHEVLETRDGVEAWYALRRPDAPRLAVLDWMMPEPDRVAVVQRVRARPAELPPCLIMLTTRTEKQDVVAGLEAGADDCLAKPFDMGELRARVEAGRRMLDLQERLAAQVRDLRRANEHIRTLRGILPILLVL